ncbi:MAG: rhomboid family intramembrane serine protease [Campylobacterales bacterium]|nr:rhomboid family intramembrane serine protease [Campylobacterales bacterium]
MNNNRSIATLANILILINLIMFGVQNSIEHGTILLGLNIYFYKAELYYQLISTMFVHGGIAHILMNMFVLYQFGNLIENAIGKIKFFALYMAGGVLTSLGSLYYMELTSNWANLVGASGAISVLLGWYALKVPFERKAIVIWIILISFAPLLLGLPVAWYAHLIGFIIGWIMGYII